MHDDRKRLSWRATVPTALAMLACYVSVISGMAAQWSNDEDMGHGFLVPVVIAWIIWQERGRWRSLPLRPTHWGWAVLSAGAALHFVSAIGGGLFLGSVAFLVSTVGAVLLFAGWGHLRSWMFPVLLALFMLPKLAIVYNQTTLPLQLLASQLAASILKVVGFQVIRQGNVLTVTGHSVSVAEACNGIRYLLPLAFASLVLGYVSQARLAVRVLLFVAAVPVAILANGLRVAASAALPKLAEGTPHLLIGWVIFMVGLVALIAVERLAGWIRFRQHA